MKFAVFALLFGAASAMRLSHQQPNHLIKSSHNHVRKFLKTREEPEMSGEEENEVEAWAKSELADGGTITGPEAVEFFGKYAKKHGYKMKPEDWAWLGYMFGQADTDHNGELDAAEVQAAMGGSELKVPRNFIKKMKKYIKAKEEPELSSGEEEEIEKWAEHELTTGDKTITKKEAAEFLAKFAKKHGYKMTKKDWEEAEKMFDDADTNHDGELDLDEVVAACGGDEIKVPMKLKTLLKAKESPEEEVEAWAEHELTTGDKTITKEEAAKFLAKFAKKHGYKMTKKDWEEAEKMFDDADTNHDGELDMDEVVAACGGEEIKVNKVMKLLKKGDDEDEMSEGEEDEVEAWAKSELADGGTITGPEAVEFFGKYAKKHGYKMKPEDWAWLGYMFGQMDTNHDGELDAAEVEAAMGGSEIKLPVHLLKKYIDIKRK